MIAKQADTIKISNKFLLYNGLYILEFTFNMVSVQLVIASLICKLIFSFNECQIQDVISSKVIGLDELHDGLYLSQIPEQKNCMNITHSKAYGNKKSNEDIWYQRLGHPFDKVTPIPILISRKILFIIHVIMPNNIDFHLCIVIIVLNISWI